MGFRASRADGLLAHDEVHVSRSCERVGQWLIVGQPKRATLGNLGQPSTMGSMVIRSDFLFMVTVVNFQ